MLLLLCYFRFLWYFLLIKLINSCLFIQITMLSFAAQGFHFLIKNGPNHSLFYSLFYCLFINIIADKVIFDFLNYFHFLQAIFVLQSKDFAISCFLLRDLNWYYLILFFDFQFIHYFLLKLLIMTIAPNIFEFIPITIIFKHLFLLILLLMKIIYFIKKSTLHLAQTLIISVLIKINQ